MVWRTKTNAINAASAKVAKDASSATNVDTATIADTVKAVKDATFAKNAIISTDDQILVRKGVTEKTKRFLMGWKKNMH
jgi:hypothetical protein